MSAEFDQLMAEFDQFQAGLKNVDDRFEQLAGMQSELAALEVSATSPDRSVTVVAGPGGAVRDIRLTEAALQLGAEQLGTVLMSTLQQAVADAALQQAGILQEYVGDAPVLDQVLETQSQAMGVPIEELREKVRPRREADTDEEPTVFRDSFDTPRPEPGTSDSYLRDISDDEEN